MCIRVCVGKCVECKVDETLGKTTLGECTMWHLVTLFCPVFRFRTFCTTYWLFPLFFRMMFLFSYIFVLASGNGVFKCWDCIFVVFLNLLFLIISFFSCALVYCAFFTRTALCDSASTSYAGWLPVRFSSSETELVSFCVYSVFFLNNMFWEIR